MFGLPEFRTLMMFCTVLFVSIILTIPVALLRNPPWILLIRLQLRELAGFDGPLNHGYFPIWRAKPARRR